MLKTNSRTARENLRSYIIDHTCHNDETPCTTFEESAETIKRHFTKEKLYKYNVDLIRQGRTTKKAIFIDWLQGLPLGGLGDFNYHCNAVDILGDILEETEEERGRFTEEQARDKLNEMIYNAIY